MSDNKEITKSKIEKTCHVVAILMKIARIACFVAVGMLLAGIVYVAIKGDLQSIQVGNVKFMAPVEASFLNDLTQGETILILSSLLLKFGIGAAICIFAGRFFSDAGKESTPFTMKNVNTLRIIAVLFLVLNVFGSTVKDTSEFFSLDIAGISGAFIIWAISYMFEYGCNLQAESDETL